VSGNRMTAVWSWVIDCQMALGIALTSLSHRHTSATHSERLSAVVA
jgi:hypothetical protein